VSGGVSDPMAVLVHACGGEHPRRCVSGFEGSVITCRRRKWRERDTERDTDSRDAAPWWRVGAERGVGPCRVGDGAACAKGGDSRSGIV
jgi:hypothetical protein